MGRECSRNREKRNAYRVLIGKPERKMKVGRPDARGWIILTWILER
jgi:hypothetical protein